MLIWIVQVISIQILIFLHLKEVLVGQRFDDKVKDAVKSWLTSHAAFDTGIQIRVSRYDKFFNVLRDYLEK